MKFEPSLNKIAESYQAQGFKVVVRPGPDDLPEFARNFRIEILAKRDDVSVLVSVKKDQSDLEADTQLAESTEITNQQSGWRFDLFVLGHDEPAAEKQELIEPSEEDIVQSLNDVERMLQTGFVQQSFIAGWAILESSMRRRLQAEGEEAGSGTSSRTLLNDLYAGGHLSVSEFRDLEGLFQARNAIVHGFKNPIIEKSAVQFLLKTARELMKEPQEAA